MIVHIVLVLTSLLALCRAEAEGESRDRYLSLPKLDKCNSRFKEFQYKNRNYFYSGHNPELKDKRLDWLDSRNTCREYCMETVSFEEQGKFDFFKKYLPENNISFIWTSGRLCDFDGCEGRWDLLPKRIKGWLWSANQVPIHATNKIPPGWTYQPWSFTGLKKKPQPDNAEFYISQTSESCLGILNNMYNDSVAWHDIACYHRARFICEDSEILLKEVLEQKEEKVPEVTEGIPTKTTSAVTKPSTTESTTERKAEQQTKRRKVVRKKILPSSNQEKINKSEDDKNETINLEPQLTAVAEEKDNIAAVTSEADVKLIEEVETTTIDEIKTTTKRLVRARGILRRRN